jgi:hypothetical protein
VESEGVFSLRFSVIEVKLSGELTYRGIDEKGAIAAHPTALQEAFSVGQELAAEPATG